MTEEQKVRICAEAAHEMNRVWCKTHGDTTQVTWDQAPVWQKASAINGVRGALNGNTPRQSHESWLKEKADAGWKFGPVKDADKKEHPCFVPYALLPPVQRAKDYLFVHTVKTTWEALNGIRADGQETP
jgi:hypothetical protein